MAYSRLPSPCSSHSRIMTAPYCPQIALASRPMRRFESFDSFASMLSPLCFMCDPGWNPSTATAVPLPLAREVGVKNADFTLIPYPPC